MNIGQLAVNTLVTGGELGVIALGLSLAFALLGFANFAHVQFVTVGAYLTLVATGAGLPLVLAAIVGMALTGLLAIGIDAAVFRPMRDAPGATKMIASFGIATSIAGLVLLIFGDRAQSFDVDSAATEVLGGRITPVQMLIVVATLVSIIALRLILERTKLGTALRATADNFTLAQARGIPSELVITFMWFLVGAFAAFGGILLGMDTQVSPGMGSRVILPAFAAATLGGLGSTFGAVVGAMLLAFAQNLVLQINFGSIVGGSAHISPSYTQAIALVVLVGVLLVRPRGLFGRPRAENR